MSNKFYALAFFVITAFVTTGCSTARTTTTERTAVEMALISETTTTVVEQFQNSNLSGKKFFLDTEGFEPVDKHFVISELKLRMLLNGMTLVDAKEDADIIVVPRAGILGLDDNNFLFGIPSFPIPIPSVGTVETPEIALYKRDTQKGRAKIGVYGLERESGNLVFNMEPKSANHYYNRYTLFIFFSWDRTDMDSPYDMKHSGTPKTVK